MVALDLGLKPQPVTPCASLGKSHHLSASFYGDSYIRLPKDDASAQSDIRLHFRTHRADGMLLIAAGSTDYCVVALQDGMLRVYMDLGSGEASLGSVPGLLFNDNQWHFIHITRDRSTIKLKIDNIYTTEATCPGRYYELNINKGIFLGGTGTWSDEVFYGNFDNFRGCMQDVSYNGIDIINAAKQDSDLYNVYGITWDCSPEFGATSDQPITFLNNKSYVAFPSLESRNEVRLIFEIRTRSASALVVYSAGRKVESDFLAIEIDNGQLKLTANKGSGQLQLQSDIVVNDGIWHQVEVMVDAVNARITVDGRRMERRTEFGDNQFLDLHDLLYLGGIGAVARSHAVLKDLESLSGSNAAAGSLLGCVQNFKINGQLSGFREARISRGLMPDCLWSYPCLSSPCIDGATCIEEGHYYYRCQCDQANCFKTGANGSVEQGATGQGDTVTPISDVIHVQDLAVREGEWATLRSNNIDLVVDYEGQRIRSSSVAYKVINPPEHGEIIVDVARDMVDDVIFTMLDLVGGKVSYFHDGTESKSDSIGIELSFLGAPDDAPDIFKEKYGFTLMIQIAPNNDKPSLRLPADDTLVLVVNTEVLITRRVLAVEDSDDSPSSLEITVSYMAQYDIGYFEIEDALGVRARITTFTWEDILEERIKYVHRGQLKQEVGLQVYDGKDAGDRMLLKVTAVPLKLRLVADTGLIIPFGTAQLITSQNLSFATNAPNQDFDIRYEVTDPPVRGEIQRQQYANNQWTTVSVFTQRHIDKNRIQYFHYGHAQYDPNYPEHEPDYFKFKVFSRDQETDELEFTIQTIKPEVILQRKRELVLEGVREALITVEYLLARSSIPYHGPKDVVYTVISTPQKGHLHRLVQRPHSHKVHWPKLITGSNFTQEEINQGSIIYSIQRALLDPIQDDFGFQLHIPGASSAIGNFSLRYAPTTSDFKEINNGLMDVIEGETRVITPEDLYLQKEDVQGFKFHLLDGPMHGSVDLIEPDTGKVISRNARSFTSLDINERKVYYKHDDSESVEDGFNFLATPVLPESEEVVQEISEFTGRFEIKILLRNDNAPKRVVDKVFNVVANRGRVMTTEDLQYLDPDINFDSMKLEYTNKGFPNGEMVRATNHSIPMFKFTQQQLHDGEVYFKHHGPIYGRNVIMVSDVMHLTRGLFEIRASDPYIRIVNNTGITLKTGESVVIHHANLSVESNLDADDKDVKFIVKQPTKYGHLVKNGMTRQRFTQADLKAGHLIYVNTGNGSVTDMFRFESKIEDIAVSGSFHITLLSENHQDPPRIETNKVSACDEEGSLLISRRELEIRHPETASVNIKYTLIAPPKYGILGIKDGPQGEDLRMFTQADINQNKLKYFHQVQGEQMDVFMFDVTNGITSLKNLEFVIEIVPNVIPLDIEHFTVGEGAYKVFTLNVIKVPNEHYAKQPLEYFLVKEPDHGWIEEMENEGVHVLQFTQSQLNDRLIAYVHDGSDTTTDSFSIIAKLPSINKQSNPFTVEVTIEPKNDQVPKVIVNSKLVVWTGSTVPITSANLYVEDKDTPPEEIMYVISNPTNGDITLKDRPNHNIVNFTQDLINKGMVIFRHRASDSSMGTFTFEVTDGRNKARDRIFVIEAKALVLSLANHKSLEVFPGLLQPITMSNLEAVTNDPNQTLPIMYTLQSKPIKGRLVTVTNMTYEEVTTFSQTEINEQMIAFRHTSSMEGWVDEDAFIFEVSTVYALTLKFKSFHIRISYENINADNVGQLLLMKQAAVPEGGTIPITKDILNVNPLKEKLKSSSLRRPEVNYVIKELPKHGKLLITGKNVSQDTRFRQSEVDRGDISYQHDHSDTLWDAFTFLLEIEMMGQQPHQITRKASHFINVFNITINPINDQPFRLDNKYPSLQIIQGFTANITRKQLSTIDPDTPPEGIIYEIKNEPNNGIIVSTTNQDKQIKKFTQKDINDGKIMFIQDGSMEHGAFYFSVSDGKFKPYFQVFDIRVHPLTLELESMSPVEIIQGHASAYLSSKNFKIKTNGMLGNVMYNVTVAPLHGQLYMHDTPVHQFSHKNIENGEVSYIQNNFGYSEDRFQFILYDMQNRIAGKTLGIRVKPLVKQMDRPWAAAGGNTPTTLTLDALDATELALTTGSNPVYHVITPPTKGELIKLFGTNQRERRDTRRKNPNERGKKKKGRHGDMDLMAVAVFNFTHQDVANELVEYRPKVIDNPEPMRDSFTYRVSARNTQPAQATFHIEVSASPLAPARPSTVAQEVDGSKAKTPAPAAKEEKSNNPENAAGGISREHLIILIAVSGVTLIIIVLCIIIKCLKKKKKKKKYDFDARAKEDSKTPLNQPPPVIESPKDPDPRESRNNQREPNDLNNPDVPTINITSATSISSMDTSDQSASTHQARPRSRSRSPQMSRQPQRSPSPEPVRTEVSRTVPTCKVTPLLDGEEEEFKNMQGSLKRGQVTFDWESIDPELLQHCRTTNPVLHKNKYWV